MNISCKRASRQANGQCCLPIKSKLSKTEPGVHGQNAVTLLRRVKNILFGIYIIIVHVFM